MDGERKASYVFASRTAQRGDATGKPAGTASPCSRDIGPGTYDPRPGIGQATWKPWLNEPTRMTYSFASRSAKSPLKKPLTADLTHKQVPMSVTQGAMPASRGLTWPAQERKPPHFHVPFRAYPSAGGTPRGRSKGLDEFYELDTTGATPVGLFGTLTVNMNRTSRVYASTFKSRQPSRPSPDCSGGSGTLGPGEYDLRRSGIALKDPSRPNSAFMRESRGKFANVGGPRGDGGLWPEQARRKQKKEAWT